MSSEEVERFSNDLARNSELQASAKLQAAGLGTIVAFAKENGYDFTIDEVKAFIRAKATQDISDAELDALAGGTKTASATFTNIASSVSAVVESSTVISSAMIVNEQGVAVSNVATTSAGVVVLV